jgi:hypothetical protein
MAGAIYHAVSEWKPLGGIDQCGITPGRIGHVFFSPASALKVLEGRPPYWRNNTYSGMWPDLAKPRRVREKNREADL